MVNCGLYNEDDVDNNDSDDVIVEPEVVSVNNGDIIAIVGRPLVVGCAASGPEVVTCSGNEAVGNCVLTDEISDVICDVMEDVVINEVVEDVLVSVASWKPK